jgi:hypothetical protein
MAFYQVKEPEVGGRKTCKTSRAVKDKGEGKASMKARMYATCNLIE